MNASLRRVRLLFLGGLIAVSLAGSGCGSFSAERFNAVQFVDARAFTQDAEALYHASRAALEAMNYVFVRGSRADGTLEMMSRVQPGSALLPRQRRVKVEIRPVPDEGADLRIGFWETSEDRSPGGTVTATNRLLRDSTVYQPFWERLATELGLPPPPPVPEGSQAP